MTELAVIEPREIHPTQLIHQAETCAGACRAIVAKTAKNIQGRKYVEIAGWQAIATAHGCVLSARDVQSIDGGMSAIGQVIRMSDGKVLAEAEGFVGDDEKTWANRPLFARRAMAQTRAMSRAGRSAFAHVIVMMDEGYESTPAEEMEAVMAEIVPLPAKPAPKAKKKELSLEEKRAAAGKILFERFAINSADVHSVCGIYVDEMSDDDLAALGNLIRAESSGDKEALLRSIRLAFDAEPAVPVEVEQESLV